MEEVRMSLASRDRMYEEGDIARNRKAEIALFNSFFPSQEGTSRDHHAAGHTSPNLDGRCIIDPLS